MKRSQMYSLIVLIAIFRLTRVSRFQNVSILDFIGGEVDGGDKWNYEGVQSSSQIISNKP